MCDHMVHLTCNPEPPATYRSCSGYLTAAMNTMHTWMLTYGKNKKWGVLMVSTAKLMITSNANDFIDVHGGQWFFCRCQSDSVKECESM